MILKKIYFLSILTLLCSCYGQNQKSSESNSKQKIIPIIGNSVSELGKNICGVFQDKNNNYWFASNGQGVYRYDGKTLTHITVKDGLVSNYVLTIEEDVNGNLWFSTRDGYCSFNGFTFINYTNTVNNAPISKLKHKKGGLYFGLPNGMGFYDGNMFTSFVIHPETYTPPTYTMNRPYSVYSKLIDNKGNVWFGTQEKGVCRYNGNSFTFYSEFGLDKAAVRTLFQDKKGTIWAGNNGAGLFRFNGKGFTNFTDEKGLANREFLKKLGGKEGTLARPWTINEDELGNLWIGTIDAGIWKYDGSKLTNYSTKDGLLGNAIWTIYKDKKKELCFVINGEAIYKFEGNKFVKFDFNQD